MVGAEINHILSLEKNYFCLVVFVLEKGLRNKDKSSSLFSFSVRSYKKEEETKDQYYRESIFSFIHKVCCRLKSALCFVLSHNASRKCDKKVAVGDRDTPIVY